VTERTRPRTRARAAAAAGVAAAAALVGAQAAAAVPAGTGVSGTVTASWGGITGSPITAWEGGVDLVFDPSPQARSQTLAAAADPALGEPSRPLVGAQVQAVRVTRLASDKAETVVCTGDGETGPTTWEATATSSVQSVADGRVAWEILPPRVDLLRGRGDISLQPYPAPDPNGWWVADRFALPGRWSGPGTWPCPGDGAPSARLPRVIALNGQGAVPRAVSDWLNQQDWRLRRVGGAWRVMIEGSRRIAFSERPFGPQDSQRLTVTLRSDLRLTGGLARLGAGCKAPVDRIRTAPSARRAVALAKRAGMARTRFAGTRRTLPEGWRGHFQVAGPIDSQGYYPCGKGTFRITRHAPRG
jgi:hypothetical protein